VHVIAGASPDNTPAGYYWTFLFPMLLFIVIALILWALFGRPHQRVPAGRIRLALRSPGAAVAAAAAAVSAPGDAPIAGAPLTASAEAAPAAGADESDGGESAANGAGDGA
jgi:hypothetical protein